MMRNGTTSTYNWIWPYCLNTGSSYLELYSNPDDSFSLFPLVTGTTGDNKNVFGEIQGLFYLCKRGATNLASEDTITIGSSTYLVFQDVEYQTDYAYCALLLE